MVVCMHAGTARHNSLLCAAAYAQLCYVMDGPACAARLTHLVTKGSGHWRDPAEDVLDAAGEGPPPWQHVRLALAHRPIRSCICL